MSFGPVFTKKTPYLKCPRIAQNELQPKCMSSHYNFPRVHWGELISGTRAYLYFSAADTQTPGVCAAGPACASWAAVKMVNILHQHPFLTHSFLYRIFYYVHPKSLTFDELPSPCCLCNKDKSRGPSGPDNNIFIATMEALGLNILRVLVYTVVSFWKRGAERKRVPATITFYLGDI